MKAIVASLFTFSALALSSVAFAKSIPLYEQPLTTSKVVGDVDLSAGVIPIFTPKGGDWIKVGDPKNGNVGWIKASDLSGTSSSFSFTQKIISDGKEPQTYKIEFGNMPNLNSRDTQEMMKTLQIQQMNIQQSAQQIIQDMINNINKLYKQQPQLLHDNTGSVIMPIVIIPASALKEKK
jgi:hypothetical protein